MEEVAGSATLPNRPGRIEGITLRVAVTCLEENREFLPYKIKRELVGTANRLLNDDMQTGIEGCKIVEPLNKAGTGETRK